MLSLPRTLSFLYLAAFSSTQLLCPSTLSYDWQLGSVPLVVGWADSRNTVTVSLAMLAAAMLATVSRSPGANKTLLASILFLALPYLPLSNLLFTVGFVHAERTLYTCW